MKKKLLFIILPLFMLLLPFNTKAITKVNFNETSNGVINTTIHFDEGFVGGLDVVFKVSDNVKVKNFEFNSAYKSYTKKYSYDSVNHTLRIIVTTGGIGSSHNLLNSKRELTLGKITFETSSKTSVDYSLDKISLMYNDNNWKSTSIPDADLELGGNSKFTYVVNEEVPPKEDNPGGSTGSETNPGETEDEPTTPSTPSTGNNSGTTNNGFGSTSSSGSTSPSKTPNGTGGSTNTTDKNTPTSPNVGNQDEDKEESNDKEDDILVEPDEYTDDKENKEGNNANNPSKKTNKIVLIISIIAIVLVVGILIMVFLNLKNKKSDIDF